MRTCKEVMGKVWARKKLRLVHPEKSAAPLQADPLGRRLIYTDRKRRKATMSIPIVEISETERDKILALRESHFCDLKAIPIKPAKLTRALAALSNAEGGELYIGIEENKDTRANTWAGFNVREDAKRASAGV